MKFSLSFFKNPIWILFSGIGSVLLPIFTFDFVMGAGWEHHTKNWFGTLVYLLMVISGILVIIMLVNLLILLSIIRKNQYDGYHPAFWALAVLSNLLALALYSYVIYQVILEYGFPFFKGYLRNFLLVSSTV